MEKIDWFRELCERIRNYSEGEIWTSGNEILCKTENAAETIVDMLYMLYGSQDEYFDICYGYYDPVEDEKNGELDRHTGWWYVNI